MQSDSPDERRRIINMMVIWAVSQATAGYLLWQHRFWLAVFAYIIGVGYAVISTYQPPKPPQPPNNYFGGPPYGH